jgi:hydrogenase nickel incorporation protein HypA/HybF
MHEYSIVQSLLDVIDENAQRNGASKVTKVVVKIGVLSGVEPHLLEIAFNTFKEKTICEDAKFEMIIQPIIARCKECGYENEYPKNQIFFECKECNSVELDVIDGEDMLLMSLEME